MTTKFKVTREELENKIFENHDLAYKFKLLDEVELEGELVEEHFVCKRNDCINLEHTKPKKIKKLETMSSGCGPYLLGKVRSRLSEVENKINELIEDRNNR